MNEESDQEVGRWLHHLEYKSDIFARCEFQESRGFGRKCGVVLLWHMSEEIKAFSLWAVFKAVLRGHLGFT